MHGDYSNMHDLSTVCAYWYSMRGVVKIFKEMFLKILKALNIHTAMIHITISTDTLANSMRMHGTEGGV